MVTNTITPQLSPPIIIEKTSYLQWLFLALWLLTAFGWLGHVLYLKRNKLLNTSNTKPKRVNNHYLALLAACKQNNAEQALSLILPWLNNLNSHQGDPEVSSLSSALAQINNDKFTYAINNIQQHLYGKEVVESSWNGENLLTVIQEYNAASMKNNTSSKFSLNPN